MRYGIVSDVHSNLEAFREVVAALAKEKADRSIFLGDLVGYGADPHACITAMRLLKPSITIAGNHDWGVLDLLDLDYFNEAAAAAVIWTKGQLNTAEFDYLKSFRLIHEELGMTLVHGSLNKPALFNYIFDADDAYISMKIARTPLTFVGHSHAPGIYALDDSVGAVAKESGVKLERGKRYLVNVGSVGQPRDGDPRTSYCIYDDAKQTVEIKRIRYDVATAQDKIIKAGLPKWLAVRLGEGR